MTRLKLIVEWFEASYDEATPGEQGGVGHDFDSTVRRLSLRLPQSRQIKSSACKHVTVSINHQEGSSCPTGPT
jgi:hypothetical protein